MSRRAMHSQGHEEALIRRARRGDSQAQEALWTANRRWVAAVILAHRPRTIDVEDLMQDVAVKFVSKVKTLRDASSFRPWLRQIAINSCRGAARRSRPSVRLAGGEQVEPGEVAMPQAPADGLALEQRDAAKRLYQQVLSLPSEYREPLLMRCVQEMTYHQISEVLELPVTTIETRLARARRMLREELGDKSTGEGMA